MIVYYFTTAYAYFLVATRKNWSFGSLLFLSSYFVIFSLLRNNSGIDTPEYYARVAAHSIYSVSDIEINLTTEYIFSLIYILSDGSNVAFNLIHSVIVCILWCSIIYNKNLNLIILLVLPIFFIDGLVNSMRITIVYFLFILFYDNKYKIISLLYSGIHLSGYFLTLISFLKSRNLYWIICITLMSAASLSLNIMGESENWILYKLNRYISLSTSNTYSGLIDTLIFNAILLLLVCTVRNKFTIMLILISGGLAISLIGSSVFVVRLIKILIICTLIIYNENINSSRYSAIVGIFIGSLAVANFLRSVTFGNGYLPYG